MNGRILRWLCGIGAVAVPIAGLVGTVESGCTEPQIDCRSARGDFAATYKRISGDMDCGGFESAGGEIVSLESYYPSLPGQDKQDYSQVFLAIGSTRLAALRDNAAGNFMVSDMNPAHKAYAWGQFDGTTPSGNVCRVATMDAGEVQVPAVGTGGAGGAGGAAGGAGGSAGGAGGSAGGAGGAAGGAGGAAGGAAGAGGMGCPMPGGGEAPSSLPASDIKYSWTNVRVLVTADAPGTMFRGTLNYEENIGGASCKAQYDVVGIWPLIYDAAGNPGCTLLGADGNPQLDAMCNPQPDEANCHQANAPGAVQFNQRFNVHCDPKLLLCTAVEPVSELQ